MAFGIIWNEKILKWLFDKKESDNISQELIKEIQKIPQTYMFSTFIFHPSLCQFFNEVFNNKNMWYLDRIETMLFIKKCIIDVGLESILDFEIEQNRGLNKLRDKLLYYYPTIKLYDAELLCDKILSNEKIKDSVLEQFGLSNIKISKKRKKKKGISSKEFLNKFNVEVIK